MKTIFAFIDDAGNYQAERSARFTKRNPYFIKSCVMIPSEKWKVLSNYRHSLIKKYTGQQMQEIKWNHIWKLNLRDNKKKDISYKNNELFLKNIPYKNALSYAEEMLTHLPDLEAKVLCTVTPSCVYTKKVSEIKMEQWHLQDIMQRIEMEVSYQDPITGLAVIFCDQMSDDNETDIKERYYNLFCQGDFIREYKHIMDSVCFLNSHQSAGIQLADFVAGAFNGFMRGFDKSEKIFALRIYSCVRRRMNGQLIGYGIIDVPKNQSCRKHLEDKFNADFISSGINYNDDIPF